MMQMRNGVVVLAGCLLAALTYFPTFKALTHFANPALDAAVRSARVRASNLALGTVPSSNADASWAASAWRPSLASARLSQLRKLAASA